MQVAGASRQKSVAESQAAPFPGQGTPGSVGTGSPWSLPPGRVTTAGRQHTEGPVAGRGLVPNPPSPVLAGCQHLPKPAGSFSLQPQALTSHRTPELAPAENQQKRLRIHRPRSKHASVVPHGGEPVRRGGGAVGGTRRGGVGLPPFGRRGPSPGTREVWRPGLGQGQVESPLLFFPGIAAKVRAAA